MATYISLRFYSILKTEVIDMSFGNRISSHPNF